MRIILDGQEVGVAKGGPEALRLIRSLFHDQGGSPRVIQTVLMDGAPVADWEVELETDAARPDEIVLVTVPLQEALDGVVASALAYLPRLQEGVLGLCSLYREGREHEVSDLWPQVIEGLSWYSQVLGALAHGGDRSQEVAATRLERLQHWLAEIVSTWEQRDFIMLADLFEYELVPELEAGRAWLAETRRDEDGSGADQVV